MRRKIIGGLLVGSLLLAVPGSALAADYGNTHVDLTFKTTPKAKAAGTTRSPRPVSLSNCDRPVDSFWHGSAGDLEGAEHHAAQGDEVPGHHLAEEAPL
jgi:hypothetical protein